MQDGSENVARLQGSLGGDDARGGPAALEAGGPRAAAQPPLDLNQRLISGSEASHDEQPAAVLVKSRCNARTCPQCQRRRGWETRQRLLEPENLAKFKEPVLLTLTVDPKNFAGPEDAHQRVTDGGYIRAFLRMMGITIWVWVLEFQENGSPHWHILADISDRGQLTPPDLRRLWAVWRDKWGLGGLDVERRKCGWTASHAVHYITKYLMKAPKHGIPAWFLRRARCRMCQASQRVGALVFRGRKTEEVGERLVKRRRDARPLVERMSECGETSSILVPVVVNATGEERLHYVGKLDASRDQLMAMQRAGELPESVGLRGQEVPRIGWMQFRVILRQMAASTVERVRGLKAWLGKTGYAARRSERIARRQEEFLGMGAVCA